MENMDVPLIAGTFECEDANELLLSLINYKIQFHQFRHFSAQERFGVNDEVSQTRMRELAKARLEIIEYLDLAKSLNCLVSVQSTLSIKLLPRAQPLRA
ncbi:MAG: hypothetical protein BGO21_08255 [Dyadobacter sp. 50-39]|uniref:hypothetical protein n=1 Tax=Dyadobacter sp. 50-39 TaxID=1895756 RepID=UPI00095E7AD6|nr:hypothetical protein [Dyadobacter sp. 50-39]OJV20554.1 MAG: hypothetical protein BGO21_08255 [Dyadobacter sp. 50-39]